MLNKCYILKRLKQNKNTVYTVMSNDKIDFYKQYCSYISPNVYKVDITPSSIIFYTRRFIESDIITGTTEFSLNTKLRGITPYEKQYLRTKKSKLLKLRAYKN